MGFSCQWKKGESPSSTQAGAVTRCMSENQVPIVAVSEELRLPDDPSKASGDRLQIPGAREKSLNPMSQARRIQARDRATDVLSHVSQHQESGRIKFQSGFDLLKKFSLVSPRVTQCRGVGQKRKHLIR